MYEKEVRNQTINAAVGNFAGMAGFTYWAKRDLGQINAFGLDGYVADFLVTSFLFCAIVSAIFVALFRRKIVSGLSTRAASQLIATKAWLPGRVFPSAMIFGAAGLIISGLPLCIFLATAGAPPLSVLTVALIKGFWATLASTIVVPIASSHGANIGSASYLAEGSSMPTGSDPAGAQSKPHAPSNPAPF